MAGRFTASGGNITAGARDSVQDGNPATNVSFTGTYTQTPNGRALLNLTHRREQQLRGVDGQSDTRAFRGQ